MRMKKAEPKKPGLCIHAVARVISAGALQAQLTVQR